MERMDPFSATLMIVGTSMEIYANYLKMSATMTKEEALVEWDRVQVSVRGEHEKWDKMIDEING